MKNLIEVLNLVQGEKNDLFKIPLCDSQSFAGGGE